MRGGLATARWGWQRLDDVSGSSAVIDRLEMDSVYVLRVRGCNKAGYGEYSEEVYLHTPPAPGTPTPPGPVCQKQSLRGLLAAGPRRRLTRSLLDTINRALFCFLFFPFLPFRALWIVFSHVLFPFHSFVMAAASTLPISMPPPPQRKTSVHASARRVCAALPARGPCSVSVAPSNPPRPAHIRARSRAPARCSRGWRLLRLGA